jgi:hypothetical protein
VSLVAAAVMAAALPTHTPAPLNDPESPAATSAPVLPDQVAPLGVKAPVVAPAVTEPVEPGHAAAPGVNAPLAPVTAIAPVDAGQGAAPGAKAPESAAAAPDPTDPDQDTDDVNEPVSTAAVIAAVVPDHVTAAGENEPEAAEAATAPTLPVHVELVDATGSAMVRDATPVAVPLRVQVGGSIVPSVSSVSRWATPSVVAPAPVAYEPSPRVNPDGAVYAVDSADDPRSPMNVTAARVPVRLVSAGGSTVETPAVSEATTAFTPEKTATPALPRCSVGNVAVRVPVSLPSQVLVSR